MSIRNLLFNLGYQPIDAGTEWACRAVYRGGDNPTSLYVNKTKGIFYDHPAHLGGSLRELVELTIKEDIGDFEKYLESFDIDFSQLEEGRPTIMKEKVWSPSELDNLFPHYKFYEDRGISKSTLQLFKSGFQHTGTLNKRYVFPIFNSNGEIHGWAGRDMTNKKDAKWYHMGRTMSWIYPYFVKSGGSYPCQDAIKASGFVVLVESVGDMLALWERGYKNVLVTFGTKASSTLVAHIMGLGARVVISTNNDTEKRENWGANAAIDIFIRLISQIDYNKVIIALPCRASDFGDANHDFKKWEEKVANPNMQAIHSAVLKRMTELYSKGKLSKTAFKMGQAISDQYNLEFNE